jgi:alpha-ketoglutarate-dependent 2,4-dichlorophenoxyacetate dioxygenase
MATLMLSIKRLPAPFGVEILGVNLFEPLDAATFAQIEGAFNEYSVLVFHEQFLSDEEQIAFSQRFGPLEKTIRGVATEEVFAPEIAHLANVDGEGRVIPPDDTRMIYHSGNQLWHTDSSFKRVPALASLLSGREVPPVGGETEFASMRVAYDLLAPAMQQKLEGLVAEHNFTYSRGLVAPGLVSDDDAKQVPPVPQALVRTNPVNGRKGFYVASHASHIYGMAVEDGRALLRELTELATQPHLVYRHVWQVGDLVMWDNRCMLHRGRPWDGAAYRRVMHRTTVAGDGPTAEVPANTAI